MDAVDMGSFDTTDAKPDFGGYINPDSPILHIPGDIHCSWKWHSTWQDALDPSQQTEFKAAIAQLNFHMNWASSRYGYILTDAELVLFKKKDNQLATHLYMAQAIPLTTFDHMSTFSLHHGYLTPLLALWYIHMLAACDDEWSVEILPKEE